MSATAFMEGIAGLVCDLIKQNNTPNAAYLPLLGKANADNHKRIGTCPRCGGSVVEGAKGFFCENKACSFALWKSNYFFSKIIWMFTFIAQKSLHVKFKSVIIY